MAPRTAGGHCQGRAELRDDTSSARAQTKGSPHSRKSNFIDATVDTLKRDTTDKLRQETMELAEKVMILEERTTFLGELLNMRRGTREVENFVRKSKA